MSTSGRAAAALGAAIVIAAALSGPLERRADASFAWHMAQHVALIFAAAPLLTMAAPLPALLRTLRKAHARALAQTIHSAPLAMPAHPLAAWTIFVVTLWSVHFSALYEAALEHPFVHLLEHVVFFGAAMLFWYPLLGGAARWRPSYPVRILYVFMAIPQGAFLGAALFSAHGVLYSHYADAGIADQRAGAALMWIAGGVVLFATELLLLAAWARHDRRSGYAAPVG